VSVDTGVDRGGAPKLRRDAQRNRSRLVTAARAVFAEQGLDASLDEIARRAGVGNATLYRHFPTREKLYTAVFADLGAAVRELAERALRIADAWTALIDYAEGLCALTATDRGVCDLVMSGFPEPPSMSDGIQDTLRELVVRVQAQGTVRADITFVDVQTAICSVLLMIPASMPVAPSAWHRHLRLTLDGLRPAIQGELPAASLTEEQFHRIALRLFPAMNPTSPPGG
jgi:AcrR family transcriptional regulator